MASWGWSEQAAGNAGAASGCMTRYGASNGWCLRKSTAKEVQPTCHSNRDRERDLQVRANFSCSRAQLPPAASHRTTSRYGYLPKVGKC